MIYRTIDTIPAKLFFKIVETENVKLLCTTKTNEDLSIIWESIKAQDEANNPDSKQNKVVEVSAEIESYLAKLNFIKHAVYYLKIKDDTELKEVLAENGYTYETKEQLERILLQSDGINDKIDRLRLKLPKPNKNQKHVPIDEMILSCGVISGAGFIDTNSITKTQLDALIKITESKIKASKVKDGKKR